MMRAPTASQYRNQFQNLEHFLRIPSFRLREVCQDGHQPWMAAGNFAAVFQVVDDSERRWALRCFTTPADQAEARYAAIHESLGKAGLPYFVDFAYHAGALLVDGSLFPIVKMEWVEGRKLGTWVGATHQDAAALIAMANDVLRMVHELEARDLAHGDLSSDNILVTAEGLKLVDYDALVMPRDLWSVPAPEGGTKGFRHPERAGAIYALGVDRFPGLVVACSLIAIAENPDLWTDFGGEIDRLLFRETDLADPGASAVFRTLSGMSAAPELQHLVAELATWCSLDADRFGDLPERVRPEPAGRMRRWRSRREVARYRRRKALASWPSPRSLLRHAQRGITYVASARTPLALLTAAGFVLALFIAGVFGTGSTPVSQPVARAPRPAEPQPTVNADSVMSLVDLAIASGISLRDQGSYLASSETLSIARELASRSGDEAQALRRLVVVDSLLAANVRACAEEFRLAVELGTQLEGCQ